MYVYSLVPSPLHAERGTRLVCVHFVHRKTKVKVQSFVSKRNVEHDVHVDNR